jgi:hypothetical protein
MDVIGIVLAIVFALGGYLLAIIIYKRQERSTKRYQDRLQSLEERNRADAWNLYRAGFSNWTRAETLLAKTDQLPEALSHEVSRLIGGVHVSAIELTRQTIKLIKSTEPVFNEKTLAKWRAEGKIPTDFQLEQFKAIMKS